MTLNIQYNPSVNGRLLTAGTFNEFCVSENALPPKKQKIFMKWVEHIPMAPNKMNLAMKVLQKVSILKIFIMTKNGGFQNSMTLAITPKNVVLRDNFLKQVYRVQTM